MNSNLHGLYALASFAFVMSITPGPNNLMLLASGARFGVRRTVPHLLGITAGFMLLLAVTWAGVGALLLAVPQIGMVLTLLCIVYLLWLGWLLLRSPAPADPATGTSAPAAAEIAARPLRWGEAAAFQFVNPKAWGMAVTATSLVRELPLPSLLRLALLVLLSGMINLPCVFVWCAFGAVLRRHLARPRVRLAFNLAMAACIVATAAWMLWPLLTKIF